MRAQARGGQAPLREPEFSVPPRPSDWLSSLSPAIPSVTMLVAGPVTHLATADTPEDLTPHDVLAELEAASTERVEEITLIRGGLSA
jgi:hypothetical protein